MLDLFMCLLLNLGRHGKIAEANMYKDGTYSNVTVKTDNGTYKVSVIKETEQDGNKNLDDDF